jgi:hypothetical protein
MTPALNYWICLGIHALLLAYDDIVLHRRRGLPRWERIGHPIDAAFFSFPIGFVAWMGASASPSIYFILALMSCLIIIKDEWVHVKRINGLEATLHAALFVIHPVTLYTAWELGKTGQTSGLRWTWVALLGVVAFQIVYWNFGGGSHEPQERP